MDTDHIEVLPKRDEWIVKIRWDVYLGPYSYKDAIVTAVALADAAWQLGRRTAVILEDRQGEHRTVWDHPTQRRAAYA